jgi:Zn-dependent protease with chaperone function
VTLTGTYYEATSSRAQEVIIHLAPDDTLRLEAAGFQRQEALSECPLSEPLGSMARHFTLPDGARIEITDIAMLAQWEKQQSRSSGMHFVHGLESRWLWVGASACFLLAFMAALYIWGLPIAAKQIAFKIPPKINEIATDQARSAFTHLLSFEASKLPAEKRDRLSAQFLKMATAIDPKHRRRRYRLEFFAAPMPNAFALPDGLVCITDELIEKAKDDKEIYGVLAHEIIHVREQHGMRSVLQNSAVFLIWTLMTGDVSTVAGMGSALPAMLAQSGYSRGFETEADQGAADYMIKVGWGTQPLADLLQRIDPELSQLGDAGEMIATHPLTEKRVQLLKAYGEQAKARLEPPKDAATTGPTAPSSHPVPKPENAQ